MKRVAIVNSVVGKTFNSNSFGKFTVLKYENYENVYIQFEHTGGVNITDLHRVRDGSVFPYRNFAGGEVSEQ